MGGDENRQADLATAVHLGGFPIQLWKRELCAHGRSVSSRAAGGIGARSRLRSEGAPSRCRPASLSQPLLLEAAPQEDVLQGRQGAAYGGREGGCSPGELEGYDTGMSNLRSNSYLLGRVVRDQRGGVLGRAQGI